VDGVLALNQPGSSMKPFLYALALERGLSPATLFADIPRDFGAEALYIPQNFNNRFNGPVLMRQALASSLNIPAVELLHRLGQKGYADFLRGLGFASLEGEGGADAAGLGLALGNAPVSILELARAFSAFPNDGRLIEPVYRKDGRASEPPPAAMSADSARIICSFLSDADSRVLAFGRARNFKADVPALFKTGTANQYQSIVALAASRRYTVAVWMGNFSGQTVIGKTGSSIPAAIARNTLNLLHSGAAHSGGREGALDFPPPEGFRMTELCAASGMGAGAACLERVHEYVAKDAPPAPPCTWHRWEDGLSTLTYPAEYQGWFLSSKRSGGVDYSDAPLSLVSPRNGFVYFFNPADAARSEIPVELTGGTNDVLEIDFDGMRLTAVRPFIFKLPANRRGLHTLTVRCGDETQEAVFRLD
jgi:penicillin-binding protein 1C